MTTKSISDCFYGKRQDDFSLSCRFRKGSQNGANKKSPRIALASGEIGLS
jgi:hypothetical protein